MEAYNTYNKKFTNNPGTNTKTQTVQAQKATLNCNVAPTEEGHHYPQPQQHYPPAPVVVAEEGRGSSCFMAFIAILVIFILLFLFWYVILDCVDLDWCKSDCDDRHGKREKDCCRVLWGAFIATIITLIFLWVIYWACTRKKC